MFARFIAAIAHSIYAIGKTRYRVEISHPMDENVIKHAHDSGDHEMLSDLSQAYTAEGWGVLKQAGAISPTMTGTVTKTSISAHYKVPLTDDHAALDLLTNLKSRFCDDTVISVTHPSLVAV